jgi:ribonuclease Y
MTTYLQRWENLERIAFEFPGVERAFAIQAGRELRVVVKPEVVDDQASLRMARDLARRIEEELLYPGQIRITVVRETRCVEYAK